MTEYKDQLDSLIEKLDELKKKNDNLSEEIRELDDEITRFKMIRGDEDWVTEEFNPEDHPETFTVETDSGRAANPSFRAFDPQITEAQPDFRPAPPVSYPQIKSDLEKFIGENLINKIGIAITVIGVAIGAKYSIDHDLISPLTRIILGYLVGLGLLGIGIRLSKNYQNYSAVLVSGAIAILYFITYFAYSLYRLMPQSIAFLLMVAFTAYAVFTAIQFNRQVIAHIGMVGAYAVPFLLGDKSGNIIILFSYIVIINIGILIISVGKYWKSVYYTSFGLSWLIYYSWYSQKFQPGEDLGLALIFLSVFFAVFYAVFLAYKLHAKEQFKVTDVFLLLANSFIFYGIGYSILKNNESGDQLLGLFTLLNAMIHFGVGMTINRQKPVDKNLFYLIAGLFMVFVTIAIPVQLNGSWVTLFWAGEAAVLFWIGRKKGIQFYEFIGFALILLTLFSIVQDWTTAYHSYTAGIPESRIFPLFNINFLTSLIVMVSFGFINILNFDQKYPESITSIEEFKSIISVLIPASLLIVIYYSFRIEIATYWNQLYIDSVKIVGHVKDLSPGSCQDEDLLKFQSVWIINYSLFLSSVITFVNVKKLRSAELGIATLVFSTLFIVIFLGKGLADLSYLRESYISQSLSEYYHRTGFNIGIRYISYSFVALTLSSVYTCLKEGLARRTADGLKIGFDLVLHITVLWIISSELNTWMELLDCMHSSKLGLTILWGLYSLSLIVLGIWKKKKHIRIGAFVLFGITLYKLFFFDMKDMDTISKTIVFLSLGVLLLVISFLYNKYKHLISD